MSIGSTPENFVFLFLLLLGALPAAFLLMGFGRLLQWLFRIKNDLFALGLTAFSIIAAILGSSLYLDLRGDLINGSVLHKSEEIKYREEGDWEFERQVTVEYTLPGQSTATASLRPPVTEFDGLQEGGAVALRVLHWENWPSLVRLADQSTLTWLPWGWIGGGLALLVVVIVFWKIRESRLGCWPGIILVLVLATVPFVNKWREWQASQDSSLTPLRVSTTVEEVRRVTWLDPLPGKSSRGDEWETGFDVPQPYDIVTVRFRPQGHIDRVLGVDAVDAGQPAVRPGMSVVVEYGADNPRAVRLLDARRLHYWRNPIGWVQSQMIALLISVGLMTALGWLGRRLLAWFNSTLARRTSPKL